MVDANYDSRQSHCDFCGGSVCHCLDDSGVEERRDDRIFQTQGIVAEHRPQMIKNPEWKPKPKIPLAAMMAICRFFGWGLRGEFQSHFYWTLFNYLRDDDDPLSRAYLYYATFDRWPPEELSAKWEAEYVPKYVTKAELAEEGIRKPKETPDE